MAMTDAELEALIRGIKEQLDELYRRDPMWKKRGEWPADENESILYPPASNAEIRALEKKLKKSFPPSYQQFLRLHNGWKHFWLDFTLLGASGDHTEQVLAELKETQQWQKCQEKDRIGDLTPERIRAWESMDESNLFLGDNLPFGANFGGEVFVFESRTPQADGEMRAVFWTMGYGAWEDRRYATFVELLQRVAVDLAAHLKKVKRPKAKK